MGTKQVSQIQIILIGEAQAVFYVSYSVDKKSVQGHEEGIARWRGIFHKKTIQMLHV
jgi:hypothetical protein